MLEEKTQDLMINFAQVLMGEKTRDLKKDPRLTRVGRFLRSSGFDELPQLINVWRGEMSLIVRPHRKEK
jgi:lipopolysaccharide/colanic/teichoic acid biosynthesis glycosyltransferase